MNPLCNTFNLSAMDHGMPMGMMNSYPMDNMAMLGHQIEPFPMMQWQMNNANFVHNSASSSMSCSSNNTRCSSKSNTGGQRIPYPRDFVPSVHHVICGRGKKSYGHCGNKNFLTIVAGHIDEYAAATTKQEKSDIVQSIVDILEAKGGFIRLDAKTGLYYKAEDGAGREKTSQALRDCLNHKYKSSKDIKRKNRKQKRLAKQAVHQHVSEKRPSMTSSTAAPKKTTTKRAEESSTMPDLTAGMRPLQTSYIPARTVSCTGVDMAAAAAAVSGPMPVSPTPILNEWSAMMAHQQRKHHEEIHLIHELEPLPFQTEEVEKLPEGMAPFDIFM